MEESKRKHPREYMLMAIEAMKQSKQEARDDHPCPMVGAVLVFPDGEVEVAHRGELREGDHAEYTLRDKYKLPLPIITYDEPDLIVTFPRTAEEVRKLDSTEVLSQLNDEELAGLDFVKARGEVSRNEYEEHFGFERKKASNQLKKLRDLNLIVDNGENPKSNNYKYVYSNK